MITNIDTEIYSEIFQEKSLTEKYLGYVDVDWEYSEVKYTADCTLAIQFDLFDKVIVGILSIDEVLSIEQIGEILGMNLIHNPEKNQYKDEAEYDILRIALDSLKDYNMIEIGDTSYSSCTLTKEGKLFAAKGYKFRVEESKPFRLFFDHTSGRHEAAKNELEARKGKPIKLKTEFDFLDEIVLQNIAEVQVPEIHNKILGTSFINPRIDIKNSASFILKIASALLFDLETKKTRFIAFDHASKRINRYFTDFLNLNKKDIFNSFTQDTEQGIIIDDKSNFVQILIQEKTVFQNLLSSNPQDALLASKKSNSDAEFIDQEYFWLNLKDFISKDVDEIFLLFPDATEFTISKIKQLAEDKELPTLFVVFEKSTSAIINNKMLELYQFSTSLKNHLFVAVYEEVTSFELLLKNKKGIKKLDESSLLFFNDEVHLSKPFYRNEQTPIKEFPFYVFEIKKSFANDYLKIIETAIEEICDDEVDDGAINKNFILEKYSIALKANAFINVEIDSIAKASLDRIRTKIRNHIAGIKSRHKRLLEDRLLKLSSKFEGLHNNKLEDIVQFENRAIELGEECLDDYTDIKSALNTFKKKILTEIKRIKDEVLAKTYIIDTNVFIKEPDIISKIDSKHYVALSLTVIEELDKLKMRPDNKEQADKAIRNINIALSKSAKNKASRIRKARADLTLLPDELQKKTADNLLLSLGLVYKKNNPTLITLDRNFQSKAMMLDIPLITINELLGIKEEPKQKIQRERNNKMDIDFKSIFNEMKPNKKGELTIFDFINQVKKRHPDFDFRKLGYETAFNFVFSLRIFYITEYKFIKLK